MTVHQLKFLHMCLCFILCYCFILVPKNAIKQSNTTFIVKQLYSSKDVKKKSIISTFFSLLIITWTWEIFVLIKITGIVNQVRLEVD